MLELRLALILCGFRLVRPEGLEPPTVGSPERLRALVSTLPSVKPAENAKVVEFPNKE